MTTTDSTITTRPRTVTVSRLLYVIGAVLGLVGAIVLVISLPAALDTATQQAGQALQGTDTSGVDVDTAAKGVVIVAAAFSIVTTLAFSILTIVFAGKMLLGKQWARVVLAVFAGLQIFGLAGSYGVGALHFLVVLAALVLSFLPASNAWFRAVKASRPTT